MTRQEFKNGLNDLYLDHAHIHSSFDKSRQCLIVHIENYFSVEEILLESRAFRNAVGGFLGGKLLVIFRQSAVVKLKIEKIDFGAAFWLLTAASITHLAIVLPESYRNSKFFGLLEDKRNGSPNESHSRYIICRTFSRVSSGIAWMSQIH